MSKTTAATAASAQAKRNRASIRRLFGPDFAHISNIAKRIRRKAVQGDGRAYVYRRGNAPLVLISHRELEGRTDLMAVYDATVTNEIVRADLYGITSEGFIKRKEVSYRRLDAPNAVASVAQAIMRRASATVDGRAYLYRREGEARVYVAGREVEDRGELIGVYGKGVTQAMLREDLGVTR
jgi:hypothetical protein